MAFRQKQRRLEQLSHESPLCGVFRRQGMVCDARSVAAPRSTRTYNRQNKAGSH